MGAKYSQPNDVKPQRPNSGCSYQTIIGAPRNQVDNCGLVTINGQQVPLKSVEVEVQVKGHVATVTSILQYVNEEESPVEAVFVFPLPAEAALCHFSAKIADQEVVAEVQEKQQAREEYDDAICSGQQAFLLEESDQSPDVFRLAVGNLPPKESAAVTLIYVIELAVQADDGLRFCLPVVLNPRYAPSTMDPGNVPEVVTVPASMVPYTLSLSVHIISPSPISKVESNCSLEPLTYLNSAQTQAKVGLSPGHMFDRDVEILLYYQDPHQPTAIVEAGLAKAKAGSLMGDSVVMVSLYPEFPPELERSSFGKHGEFIFVMDQSGSMSGSSIISARETLLLLLKSLPLGCYFNIYGFGSHFQSFFPKSVEYTQKTMEEAITKVEVMDANMGGTEIRQPLEHIYRQDCLSDHPRQVFLFTDGGVFNIKEILDLVRTHSRSHRCFTFGIGQGASTALITGMAKEGGGTAQFITSDERLQFKVMQSLSNALQPCVENISVKWNLPKHMSVTTLSPPLTVLFQGQRALLYAQLTGKSSENSVGTVTVQYSLAEQPVTNQLQFCLKSAEDTGLGIHRLAARSLIQSLEKEEREKKDKSLRKKVVELSVQAGVSSAYTAFLAIHKGNRQPVQGPLLRRTVPVPRRSQYDYKGTSRASPKSLLSADHSSFFSRIMGAKIRAPKVARESPYEPVYESLIQHKMEYSALPRRGPTAFGRARQDDYNDQPQLMESALRGRERTAFGRVLQDDYNCQPQLLGSALRVQKDPYLELISLQKAAGYWDLETRLLDVLGQTLKKMEKQKPAQVDNAVWATIVALIWLHSFRAAEQEEWKFIAVKATSWIQSQKVRNLSKCVRAGNALLGCQVKKENLGF